MPIVDYPFTTANDEYTIPKPAVPVVITNPANGFDFHTWALVDTGADATAIPEFIAKAVYHDIRNKRVIKAPFIGIGGSVDAYYHTFEIDVLRSSPKGKVFSEAVISIPKKRYAVIPNLPIMILGEKDFLKKYVLTIDYPRQLLSIRKPT